jgi:YD repeat-containing protein
MARLKSNFRVEAEEMHIRMKNGMTRLSFAVLGIFLLSLAAVAEASTVQYRYDELDRIYQVEYDDGTIVEYVYDNVGNRIQKTVQHSSAGRKIGVFRNGAWYLDTNGNGVWDAGTDTVTTFGLPGDIPVTGDWTGTGTAKIGVFRNGVWYLDANGNGVWDGGTDTAAYFGLAGDIPVVGDWNGTGTSKIGVFRDGVWYLDTNGNGVWDGGTDTAAYFGTTGDQPVTGKW